MSSWYARDSPVFSTERKGESTHALSECRVSIVVNGKHIEVTPARPRSESVWKIRRNSAGFHFHLREDSENT